MTKTSETPHKTGEKSTKKGGRSGRLAAALRENLRRRKAQIRGRDAGPSPSADNEPKSS